MTCGERIARAFGWLCGNIIIFIAVYFWLMRGNIYAQNISFFIIITHCLGGLLLFTEDFARKAKHRGPPVPMYLDIGVDFCVAFFLIAFGHWVMAILYLYSSCAFFNLYNLKEEFSHESE